MAQQVAHVVLSEQSLVSARVTEKSITRYTIIICRLDIGEELINEVDLPPVDPLEIDVSIRLFVTNAFEIDVSIR